MSGFFIDVLYLIGDSRFVICILSLHFEITSVYEAGK